MRLVAFSRNDEKTISLFARAIYRRLPHEVEHASFLSLNEQNQPIAWHYLAGGNDRNVSFRPSLIWSKAGPNARIVLLHNHCDSSLPSSDDIALSHYLLDEGKKYGVQVVDSMVLSGLSDNLTYSLLAFPNAWMDDLDFAEFELDNEAFALYNWRKQNEEEKENA